MSENGGVSKKRLFPSEMRPGQWRWFDPTTIIAGDSMTWISGNCAGAPHRDRVHLVPVLRTFRGFLALWPRGAHPWTRDYAFGGVVDSDVMVKDVFPWCPPITVLGRVGAGGGQ